VQSIGGKGGTLFLIRFTGGGDVSIYFKNWEKIHRKGGKKSPFCFLNWRGAFSRKVLNMPVYLQGISSLPGIKGGEKGDSGARCLCGEKRQLSIRTSGSKKKERVRLFCVRASTGAKERESFYEDCSGKKKRRSNAFACPLCVAAGS